MRINIFDNGLNSRSGHHFDYCLNVARSFAQRGYAVTVCGTQSAESEIAPAFETAGCTFVPLFSHFAYAPMEVGNDVVGGVNAFALTAANEMASVARADLNVFLTLKPLEYYAFSLMESVSSCRSPSDFRGWSGLGLIFASGIMRPMAAPLKLVNCST